MEFFTPHPVKGQHCFWGYFRAAEAYLVYPLWVGVQTSDHDFPGSQPRFNASGDEGCELCDFILDYCFHVLAFLFVPVKQPRPTGWLK